MASPRELWAASQRRKAAEQAVVRAKERARGPANDNRPRDPDGYITIDGEAMPYWLPATAKEHAKASA